MATRPVFFPCASGSVLVETRLVEFLWIAGLSASQKAKRIESLHASASQLLGVDRILEISTKSSLPLGVALSAFNLMIETRKLKQIFSVESAYQSSKVFLNGGPFVDLMQADSRAAKSDPRLQNSGHLIGFRFFGVDWDVEPITAFYDWLYISALSKHQTLTDELENYSAFTDIEFNPNRSVNCQAYSVATYCALRARGLVEEALSSKASFLKIVYQRDISNTRQTQSIQPELGF